MKIVRAFVGILGSIVLMSSLHSPNDPLQESIKRGKEVYENYCVSCHLGNGQGVEGVFPPLAQSDYISANTEQTIRAIKFGLQGSIKVNGKSYNGMMPAAGLDDEEVADVMNFIRNAWGSTSDTLITPEIVRLVEDKN